MSNQKLGDKQKVLFEEWVKRDRELEASFPLLKGQQLSTRKVLPKRKLLEEYRKKAREATDKHSQRVLFQYLEGGEAVCKHTYITKQRICYDRGYRVIREYDTCIFCGCKTEEHLSYISDPSGRRLPYFGSHLQQLWRKT